MMTVSRESAEQQRARIASPSRGAQPAMSNQSATAEKDKEKMKQKKEKKGLLSSAKAKATGSLRKALQKSKQMMTRDAESICEEEDEDGDCTQSNYDTVRSLPASGHYGRRRTKTLVVDVTDEIEEEGRARSSAGSAPPLPLSTLQAADPKHYLSVSARRASQGQANQLSSSSNIVVIRLPRRRQTTGGITRVSPLGAAAIARLRGSVPAAPTDPDPMFDFEAWHSTLDLMNNQDAVYSLFMKAHKCYDLIPVSTKLVVFDTHLPVRKAFYALVYNGVRAAPLWDSEQQQFVGMLTITDFIKILYGHHTAGDCSEKMAALEEQEIYTWRKKFENDEGALRPLICIDPNESLYRAVELLCESHVHRLPVMDAHTGNVSYILTHKRIIKFLSLYMHDLPRPPFMEETPKTLGIGVWGEVLNVHMDTRLIDALKIFLENRVSALPIVDDEGKVVDIYAKFDVIALAAEKVYDKLDITVHEALKHRQDWFEGVRKCRETDSLFCVLETIVRVEVHRLIVVDELERVVGIVSLSDILKYLVLDRCVEKTPSLMRSTGESSSSSLNTGANGVISGAGDVFDTLEEEDRQ